VKINRKASGTYRLFAQVQTERERDTCNVRYSALKSKSVKLVLQEETMKDKEMRHRSEKVGIVALWGKSIKRTDLYDDKVAPKKTTRKTLPRFPLKNTMMYVKTTKFNKNVVDKFYELRQALKKRSPRGYCEKQVNSMTKVSNRKICGGKTNRNIGFYFSTVFPVAVDGTKYCFHVPMDVNYGGISMLDGKI
jgi:hypothetical protein